MFRCCYAFVNYMCVVAITEFFIVKSIPVTQSHIDGINLHTMLPDAETSRENSDEDSGYADDEPDLGSSEDTMTRKSVLDSCLKIRRELVARGLAGAYIPHCLESTDYMQTECFTNGDRCWCVNSQGNEVSSNDSATPTNCTFVGSNHKPTSLPLQLKQLSVPSDLDLTTNHSPFTMDFVGAHHTVFTDYDVNYQGAIYNSSEQSPNNGTEMYGLPGKLWVYVVANPMGFAVVLGISAFVVFTVIILVLCIIYRFRKKDEGSYALDEPLRVSGQPVSQYARAPSQDREFFA